MSPASYRAAPPRVGEARYHPGPDGWRPPPPVRRTAQPVGEAVVEPAADWAAWYSWTAFCRSASACPCAAKSPLRWAAAKASMAALRLATAWSSAGFDPPPSGGGV